MISVSNPNPTPDLTYIAAGRTLVDGAVNTMMADINNNLQTTLATDISGENRTDGLLFVGKRMTASSTGACSNYNSTATLIGTAGISVKASAGRCMQVRACNTSTTIAYYLVLVDKASAPVANDVAVAALALPATSAVSIHGDCFLDFSGIDGMVFTTGISYAISTNPAKVVLDAALDCAVTMQYV